MNDLPFTLTIETISPPGRCEEVVCRNVLRAMEGIRTAYDATWDDRRIVLKIFMRRVKARRHAMREWRGLKELEARQVKAPSPLFLGRSPEGWAVATAWLDDAVSAAELWTKIDTPQEKARTLEMVARELARQHDRGVIQTDMHLGNFMIRGQEVFSLDPAMMRFVRSPAGRRQSFRQVARLAAILPERAGSAIESVFREYAEARSWTIEPDELERLRGEHRRQRNQSIEQGLRKFLRENRRHQAIQHGPWQGLVDRDFLRSAGIEAITAGLDDAMRRGHVLKNGNTCFVSRVKIGDVEVVIKRYNHKGWLHSLRHTLKGSRAKKNWINAHRLRLLNIGTARPLAYVDKRRGPLLWTSYFITEFVPGRSLHAVLHDPAVPDADKQEAVNRVLRVLDQLREHGITHGDMKGTNLLCDADRMILTDLDSMVTSIWNRISSRRHRKDIARFLETVADWRNRS